MNTEKYRVESGLQLLTRLTKKLSVEHFYPVLFKNGPKHGEVIEIYSNNSISVLLIDILSAALIPKKCSGIEAGVLIFSSDGNMSYDLLQEMLRKKILANLTKNTMLMTKEAINAELNKLLNISLGNLYILDIYDNNQFYTTIYNLENILSEHSNISLIVFDTLTSFYWSEQGFKMIKMDTYLKNILHIIQKITKEYKICLLYTRPEYFSSNKDDIENLEACCEQPTSERLNYRLQVVDNEDGTFQVNIRIFQQSYTKQYKYYDNEIIWL